MASVLLVYSYKVGTGRPRYRGRGEGGGESAHTYETPATYFSSCIPPTLSDAGEGGRANESTFAAVVAGCHGGGKAGG